VAVWLGNQMVILMVNGWNIFEKKADYWERTVNFVDLILF